MSESGLAVFINGAPGSGKSTVARRLVSSRPGWFLLDVDVLRTFVGGWSADFAGAGQITRPIVHAIIREVVGGGGVVVIPQLLYDVDDFLGFANEADDAGGEALHVVLDVPSSECWRRLRARLSDNSAHEVSEDSLASVLAAELERVGGERYVERVAAEIESLRDCAIPMHSIPGENTERVLRMLEALIGRYGGRS
ncbi:MAG TPA: AAA family ATPase [Mycobacteriales bacterium]|nr:AAA family ATPase [Mycobacteriales bacterium]